ncbi:MAG: hypothetical protein DYH14_01665 [Betaproteobacteria bacterium PRO3]|nr:hypothetical protein [Betaproteobacteria bacterium PRO3]
MFMNRAAPITLAIALAWSATANAQEACRPLTLAAPAVKLDEIYRMAEGRAKAWKADVVPARITNTILGPLEADGSSEAWTVTFFSPSANANVSINTFRGGLNCWAQPGSAGRLPDLKAGFVLDGAKLFAIAQEHGAKPLADGFFVQIGTAAAPSTRHATWNVQFTKADGRTSPPLVIVDANTGKVEKVLK